MANLTGRAVGEIISAAADLSASYDNLLLCDGSEVAIATYGTLNTALGGKYNAGDEAGGNFRLPNLVSRFPRGASSLGVDQAANQSGSDTVTLSEANLPEHSHDLVGIDDDGLVNDAGANGLANAASGTPYLSGTPDTSMASGSISSTGSGTAVNIQPASTHLLYFIVTE